MRSKQTLNLFMTAIIIAWTVLTVANKTKQNLLLHLLQLSYVADLPEMDRRLSLSGINRGSQTLSMCHMCYAQRYSLLYCTSAELPALKHT